jgi:hypothetical protein
MKKVYLISNVKQGGKTYLEYLRPALNALRSHYDCVVLQTNNVGISRVEAEQLLNHPVEEVTLDFIVKIKSHVVISNDGWVARILDDSNFAIFIAHGNVGMPAKDQYYFSELLSYWDAIVSSSRSISDLVKTGLQLYRPDRHAGLAGNATKTLRSEFRKTNIISVLPVKIPKSFKAAPDIQRVPDKCVVGLLPTQVGICPSGASLYENMGVVINSIKSQIPHAQFILRPYMTDFTRPYVSEVCEQLSQYPWITIDTTKGSSQDFYQQCDKLITDASSGGVSFMLNTCKLPIYYVPETHESHPIVTAWLEQMQSLLPIARSGDDLKDLILGLDLITPEQSYAIYKKFYESEYGEREHPDEVFLDLVQQQHDSDFRCFVIDAWGKASEFEDQTSSLQLS